MDCFSSFSSISTYLSNKLLLTSWVFPYTFLWQYIARLACPDTSCMRCKRNSFFSKVRILFKNCLVQWFYFRMGKKIGCYLSRRGNLFHEGDVLWNWFDSRMFQCPSYKFTIYMIVMFCKLLKIYQDKVVQWVVPLRWLSADILISVYKDFHSIQSLLKG